MLVGGKIILLLLLLMCTFISAIGRNFIDIGLDLNTVSEGLSRELTILVAYDGN